MESVRLADQPLRPRRLRRRRAHNTIEVSANSRFRAQDCGIRGAIKRGQVGESVAHIRAGLYFVIHSPDSFKAELTFRGAQMANGEVHWRIRDGAIEEFFCQG